jgi:hypothetical protein
MSYRDSDQAALNEKLQDLKQAMQNAAAPERVETALIAAFREHARVAPRRRPVVWPRWALAAGVAAALLVTVTRGLFHYRPVPSPEPVSVATAAAPAVPLPIAAPKLAPVRERRAVRKVPPPPATPAEIATDFIPVAPPATWQPGTSGQILRVRLPRTSLASFGLPMNADLAAEPVRADVIVSQDGVVRAIRFVR